MKENRCAVLCAEVRSLAVYLRWVVNLPKSFQQLFVSHFRGIKSYLHDFRMPCFIRTNVFVRRIRHLSPAVAYGGGNHFRQGLKRCLNTPKTPSSKRRYLSHKYTLLVPNSCYTLANLFCARSIKCD